jgi:hypothetical protein
VTVLEMLLPPPDIPGFITTGGTNVLVEFWDSAGSWGNYASLLRSIGGRDLPR